MKNTDLKYLVDGDGLPDITYPYSSKETICPRIVDREDGPYVYCKEYGKKKKSIPLIEFLNLLANRPLESVGCYRKGKDGKKEQTTISFSQSANITRSPRMIELLGRLSAGSIGSPEVLSEMGHGSGSEMDSTGSVLASIDSDIAPANELFPGADANRIRHAMSLEDFQAQLDRRSETGEAGERVALEDELKRLRYAEVGCPDPERYVKHVALTDVGRGYDIESTWPGHERRIEVKSSTSSGNDILMSDNERTVLEGLGKKAWLYRVVVDAKGDGEVVLRLNDPMAQIPKENISTAVWRVRIPKSKE